MGHSMGHSSETQQRRPSRDEAWRSQRGTLQASLQGRQARLGRQASHRAAATVQAQVRGSAVRLERQRNDTAATAMQARARGGAVRRRRQQEPPPPPPQQQLLVGVRLVGPPWRLQIRPLDNLGESLPPPPPLQQRPQLQQPQPTDLPPAVLVTLHLLEDGVRDAALAPHASPPSKPPTRCLRTATPPCTDALSLGASRQASASSLIRLVFVSRCHTRRRPLSQPLSRCFTCDGRRQLASAVTRCRAAAVMWARARDRD